MSNRDPFDIVAAASPVPGLTERLPGDDEMLATILAMPVQPAKRRPRRRTIWIGAGVTVVGVGLAAFAFTREESPRNPIHLVCYDTPQERPSAQHVIAMAADPIAACGELWTNGQIASLDQVPPLTACVLKTGFVAVIPGTQEVCSKLGIANWVGELSDEEANLLAFQEAIVATFGDQCVGEADAERLISSLLEQFGLSDWTVIKRGGYSATRQCTSAPTDAGSRLVILLARPGTPTTDEPVQP
ncbi:MAG: hypothetical protein ABMA25_13835 [Ilumatobacteraceae bacterium]